MAALPSEILGIIPGNHTQASSKIKLKLPGSSKNEVDGTSFSAGLTFKLPAASRPSIQLPIPPTEVNEVMTQSSQAQQSTSSPTPIGKPLLTAQPAVSATTSAGSRGVFAVKSASPAPSTPAITKQPTPQPHSYTPSPAPPELPLKHPIQSLVLQTTPHGRVFHLDRDEGVKYWAVRLGTSERGVRVSQLLFWDDVSQGEEIEEEDDPETGEEETTSNKGRRKLAGKDKPGAKDKAANGKKNKDAPEKTPRPEPTVRLNGTLLRQTNTSQLGKHNSESKVSKQWQGDLSVGLNNLEIRAGDVGEIWKIFLERQIG